MNLKLKEKIKEVPRKPGVYFWLDKSGRVLYVGRATNLRARLSQYFQKDRERRIVEMVEQADDIHYETTDTVLEAVILEAQKIKKYWPKYNILDRDDRSFIYLVIPKSEYPRPTIIRGKDLKRFPSSKAKVFGPYQSFYLLRLALGLIRRIFPYSSCTPKSGQACFDYQIGLCPGVCLGLISAKEYQKNIKKISLLLSGDSQRLTKKLAKENPAQLKALKQVQDVALLSKEADLGEIRVNRLEGYDISHHQGKESYGSMVVFQNGEPARDEYRLFKIKEAPAGDDERALAEVLRRRFKHREWPQPDLVVIDGGAPQISFLSRFLAENNISIPIVGISKLGGDKLVYRAQTDQSWRNLTENIKPTLLKLRDEAHRFANFGRKRGSTSLMLGIQKSAWRNKINKKPPFNQID